MSFVNDVAAAKQRFGIYIDRLRELLVEYEVQGSDWYKSLSAANRSKAFRRKRDSIWQDMLEREGGKMGLGMVLGIIGATLGAIGVAGFGGAIGIPLALLLAPLGLVFGNELDEHGATKSVVSIFRSWFPSVTSKRSAGQPCKVPVQSLADDATQSVDVVQSSFMQPEPQESLAAESTPQECGDPDEELSVLLQLVADVSQKYGDFERTVDSIRSRLDGIEREARSTKGCIDNRLASIEGGVESAITLAAALGTHVRTQQAEVDQRLGSQATAVNDLRLAVSSHSGRVQIINTRVRILAWAGSTALLAIVVSFAWLAVRR